MERKGGHHLSVMLGLSAFVACVMFGVAEVPEQTIYGVSPANQAYEVSANQVDEVPATRVDGVSANVPVIQPHSLHSQADQLALISRLITNTKEREEEILEYFANSIQNATDHIHAVQNTCLEAVERVQDQSNTDIQAVEEQLRRLNTTTNKATLQVQEQCTSNYQALQSLQTQGNEATLQVKEQCTSNYQALQSLQTQVNKLQNRLNSFSCLHKQTKLEGCVRWNCENGRWVRYKGRQITEFSELLGNNCVYIESAALTWNQARAKCKAHGADLFVLKEGNGLELEVYLKNMGGKNVWVGVSKQHTTWLDGRPVHHNEWAIGQPNNNANIVEDCALVGYGGSVKLHDYPCNHRKQSLCLFGVSYP